MTDLLVRLARPEDAPDYVAAHLASQLWAYRHLMPPEFESDRTAEVPEVVNWLADQLTQMTDALKAGAEPSRRHWVAEIHGEIVGIACAGAGSQEWEAKFDPPPPDIDLILERLYVVPAALGTGAGQALFDLAVGNRSAYLWILADNSRAERFYRRNGFAPDGAVGDTGPMWFGRRMFRMVRRPAR